MREQSQWQFRKKKKNNFDKDLENKMIISRNEEKQVEVERQRHLEQINSKDLFVHDTQYLKIELMYP